MLAQCLHTVSVLKMTSYSYSYYIGIIFATMIKSILGALQVNFLSLQVGKLEAKEQICLRPHSIPGA